MYLLKMNKFWDIQSTDTVWFNFPSSNKIHKSIDIPFLAMFFLCHLISFTDVLKKRFNNYFTSRPYRYISFTHLWSFSKSKFILKSDRVNLVAPASLIEYLLYLPNVRAIQYKLGQERLTQLGNSNVLGCPCVVYLWSRRYILNQNLWLNLFMCYIYLLNLKINVVLIKLNNCRKNLFLRICALN